MVITMGALYITTTTTYANENPMGSTVFLDVKDFYFKDDYLIIEHSILTNDCIVLEMINTIPRRYLVEIKAFDNAKDFNDYLGRYDHVYEPHWNNKNISYVIEREVDDDQFRFYRDTDVVNVEEGKKGYLNVTYSNGMVTKYPKKEALRWRVIDYIKMR